MEMIDLPSEIILQLVKTFGLNHKKYFINLLFVNSIFSDILTEKDRKIILLNHSIFKENIDNYKRIIWYEVNDRKYGMYREYVNNTLALEIHYRNNVKHGLYTRYNTDGIMSQGMYINGKEEGYWKEYGYNNYIKKYYHHGRYEASTPVKNFNNFIFIP